MNSGSDREARLTVCRNEAPRLQQTQVSYKAPIYDGGAPPKGEQRRLFTDGVSAALEDIATFQQLGVHELVFDSAPLS
jgi:hypothetical protein